VKATESLHDRGQSLWLDNITRSMLDDGAIQRYIDSYSVTGLTSNPSIFDKAIGSGDYDDAIRVKSGQGLSSFLSITDYAARAKVVSRVVRGAIAPPTRNIAPRCSSRGRMTAARCPLPGPCGLRSPSNMTKAVCVSPP